MFVLTLMAGAANANVVGIFGDMDATICSAPVMPYVQMSVYILAVLDEIPSLTAAEFGASNFPENLGYPVGQVTVTWTTSLVIGNIYEGVALAYDAPQPGPIVRLGTAVVLDFGGYAFDNHMTCIVASPANPSVLTPVVVDANYDVYEANGWCFIFNCTVGDCTCNVPTQSSDFSSIKALY
jgi:hypothetical protein